MIKKILMTDSAVVAVASRRGEEVMRWYADLLSGSRPERVHMVRLPDSVVSAEGAMAASDMRDLLAAMRQLAYAQRIGMIVCEWIPDPRQVHALLHLAHEVKAPAMFIRQNVSVSIGRVVVATSGGPHTFEQLWLTKAIASARSVPVAILHWDSEKSVRSDSGDEPGGSIPVEQLSVRILGMRAVFEVCVGPAFLPSVANYLKSDDLLVMGSPSLLRLMAEFRDTLPERLAKRVSVPLILLSRPVQPHDSLRTLFWGGLMQTGVRARDTKELISCLIGNLERHNQLPVSSRADILDRALRREAMMSTAVNCETAFPHVALPGFLGVVASMAICPEGVAFDSSDGLPPRFFVLFITPDAYCEDYLAVLGKIARRMIHPDIREALLTCKTPAQVLDVLEPREERVMNPWDEQPHAGLASLRARLAAKWM